MQDKNKDWSGNKRTTWVQLGASNHSKLDREQNDFYATDPRALEIFLKRLKQDKFELHKQIWECACGNGCLSEVLKENGYNVYSTDLVNRGYGDAQLDFLNTNFKNSNFLEADILTNPPYKFALQFAQRALDLQKSGYYTIMFLKIQFLEGKGRKKFFDDNPPKFVYVNSERQNCAKNADFETFKSSAVCYCWFIWEKDWFGEPRIRWI